MGNVGVSGDAMMGSNGWTSQHVMYQQQSTMEVDFIDRRHVPWTIQYHVKPLQVSVRVGNGWLVLDAGGWKRCMRPSPSQ